VPNPFEDDLGMRAITEHAFAALRPERKDHSGRSRLEAALARGWTEALGLQKAAEAARRRFRDRGFSPRTIDTLMDNGVDAPERLLFLERSALMRMAGVDKATLAEIGQYNNVFGREANRSTPRTLNGCAITTP